MKTTQKKLKFSNGEISEKLQERADLKVLDSSASFLDNMISTPYGTIRKRPGTTLIDNLAAGQFAVVPDVATSYIGGDADLLKTVGTFVSTGLEGITDYIKIDMGSSKAYLDVRLNNVGFTNELGEVKLSFRNGGLVSGVVRTPGKNIKERTYSLYAGGDAASFNFVTDSTGAMQSVVVTASGTNFPTSDTVLQIDPSTFYSDPLTGVYDVMISSDDTTYTKLSEITINVKEKQVDDTYLGESFTIPNTSEAFFRYIKLVAQTTTKGQIELDTITTTEQGTATSGAFKLIPFEFSATEKYVLVLSDNLINVYQDDALIQSVVATGLTSDMFQDLKYSQTEDTVVFTHYDLKTVQLQRTDTGFLFSEFPYENIPFYRVESTEYIPITGTMTPSALEGRVKMTTTINPLFTEGSVGQIIDGGGGRVRITEYVDGQNVFGYTTIPFYTTNAIAYTDWKIETGYEEVWSTEYGYPATCAFYQQRLWLGGSKLRPNTIWASRIAQYNDFQNYANYDNDSIELTPNSNQVNEIVNIYPNRGLQVFTRGAEFIAPEGSLTPSSISILKNTSNGSLKKTPIVDINGISMFIEKNGKNLIGYVYSDGQASYTTSQISLLTELIDNPVAMTVDYNSVRGEGNYLYIVNEDGSISLACILTDQKINSFIRMNTEGDYQDIISLGSDVYFLTYRNGQSYLEKSSEVPLDMATLKAPSLTITGLEDYDSLTVTVYNDDFEEEHLVIDGEVTLSELPLDDVYVGLSFTYKIISNTLSVGVATESIKKRISKATIKTLDTETINFNGKTTTNLDGLFIFGSSSGYLRNNRFTITGNTGYLEIASIVLDMNYGV